MALGGYSLDDEHSNVYDIFDGKKVTDLIALFYKKVLGAYEQGDMEAAAFYQKQRDKLVKLRDDWYNFDVQKQSRWMGYPDIAKKRNGMRRSRFHAGQVPPPATPPVVKDVYVTVAISE